MTSGVLLIGTLALGALLVYLAIGEQLERLARPRMRQLRVAIGPYLTRQTLFPLGGAVVFALIYPGILLKLYFLVAGGLVTYFLVEQRRRAAEIIQPRQIVQLVLSLRSIYQLQPSVFSSLQQVTEKLEQPLRGLIEVMTQTYYLTSSPARAFQEFRKRTNNTYLHQFIYILEMGEAATSDAMITALDSFVDRMRMHDELRRGIETNLSSVTGQTRFMQILSLLIILVVGVVPTLRTAYRSVSMQIVFMIIMSVALGTSWYIEKRVSTLKESIQ